MTKPMNLKDKLAGARRPEQTVSVCLRGDLHARVQELTKQLNAAELNAAVSLAGGTGVSELRAEIDELQQQIREHSIELTFQALPRSRWSQLVGEHAPRTTDQHVADRTFGINTDEFFPALLRESLIAPEMDEGDWASLLDEAINDAQYDELVTCVWNLNRKAVPVPLSSAASPTPRTTGSE